MVLKIYNTIIDVLAFKGLKNNMFVTTFIPLLFILDGAGSEIVGSSPTLAFKFQENKMFLPRSLVKIQYCGEQFPASNDEKCIYL